MMAQTSKTPQPWLKRQTWLKPNINVDGNASEFRKLQILSATNLISKQNKSTWRTKTVPGRSAREGVGGVRIELTSEVELEDSLAFFSGGSSGAVKPASSPLEAGAVFSGGTGVAVKQ